APCELLVAAHGADAGVREAVECADTLQRVGVDHPAPVLADHQRRRVDGQPAGHLHRADVAHLGVRPAAAYLGGHDRHTAAGELHGVSERNAGVVILLGEVAETRPGAAPGIVLASTDLPRELLP